MSSVLVYWVDERNWSIIRETAVREPNPGVLTTAKFLGKAYPALVIAKAENARALKKDEDNFRDFLNKLLPEDPLEIDELIIAYVNKLNPCTVTESEATDDQLSREQDRASVDVRESTRSPPIDLMESAQSPPIDLMESAQSPSIDLMESAQSPPIDLMESAQSITFNSDSSSDHKTSHRRSLERRVAKLEKELKELRSSFRSFKRKYQEEEHSGSDQPDLHPLSAVADEEKEIQILLSSVSYMTCQVDKEVNDCLKRLCFALFNTEELVKSSRTGKKTIKSGGFVRPALDTKKMKMLEMAMLRKCPSMGSDLFKKKMDNLIKMTRRSAKAKTE